MKYVNVVNKQTGISGGAKKLARFAKAWKYYNNVPISSFYLEMRAAKYMTSQSSFIPVYDVCFYFEHLHSIGLAAMNDPKGLTSRFYACSSDTHATEALSKVNTAATRARKAVDAHQADQPADTFGWLDLILVACFLHGVDGRHTKSL